MVFFPVPFFFFFFFLWFKREKKRQGSRIVVDHMVGIASRSVVWFAGGRVRTGNHDLQELLAENHACDMQGAQLRHLLYLLELPSREQTPASSSYLLPSCFRPKRECISNLRFKISQPAITG